MPTPTTSYTIGVKISGGTAGQVYVNFKNGRTADMKRILTVTNEAKINLGNEKDFPNGFNRGDVIEINCSGRKTGGTTHTIDSTKGGANLAISLTDVSTTNAPAISI